MTTDDLDRLFFQKILRNFEHDETIEIRNLEKEPACEKGQNFIALASRVKICGSRKVNGVLKDYTKVIFTKTRPPTTNKFIPEEAVEEAFKNEVTAYTQVVPALNSFLSEPLAVPKCIYASKDVIALEDLTCTGFADMHQTSSLSLDMTENVLKEIAKLHAASFVMKHKDPEHFEQLVNQLTEILYKKDVQSFALENQQQQITTVINLMESLSSVDNKYGEAISLLKEVEGKSNDLLTELILSRDKYSIINHGDLWMNNIMHREGQIKFVDLQVMRCTSVAADLHYFLNINVLPHILIKNIEHLFNVYLKFLHFHIHSQGVNLENELNLTWLKSEMQKFSLYGLVNGIWIGVVFYVKEELKDVANFEMDDVMTRIPVDCKMRLGDIVLNYVQMRSLV